MMMKNLLFLLPHVALVSGHGLMIEPEPRDGTTNAGDAKGPGRGPCGINALATKGDITKTYAAGDKVVVTWQTDAAHGGTCQISLSVEDGVNEPTIDENTGILINDNTLSYPLTNTFSCCGTTGTESMEVTIPDDIACESCTLQWYWDGDQPYYNCADVKVTSDASEADETATLLFSDALTQGCSTFDQGCGDGTCNAETDECDCVNGYFGLDCSMYYGNTQHAHFTLQVSGQESIDKKTLSSSLAEAIYVNEGRVRVLGSSKDKAADTTHVYVQILDASSSDSKEPELFTSYTAGLRLLRLAETEELDTVTGLDVTSVTSEEPKKFNGGKIALGIFLSLVIVGLLFVCYKKKDTFLGCLNKNKEGAVKETAVV